MGHGITQTFAAAGYLVRCYDEDSAVRATVHDRVRANLQAFVDADLLPSQSVEPILGRILCCQTEAAAVADVAFVAEAVKEDLAVKQELFARLEALVSPGTILASNSSTFPISQSGSRLRRPEASPGYALVQPAPPRAAGRSRARPQDGRGHGARHDGTTAADRQAAAAAPQRAARFLW